MEQKRNIKEESLSDVNEIENALNQVQRKNLFKVVATTNDKIAIPTYILILIGLAIFQQLLKLGFFDFLPKYLPFTKEHTESLMEASGKIAQGATTIILVLTISALVRVFFVNGITEKATRYNLNRVLNLAVGIILFFIVLSILFANWYAAVYSLGLISLILGFALQTPITSFIAWIYIIINRPYKVGDRIKLADAVGDVIDIGYLETTLWESSGDVLGSDFPTGRIIRFPNSSILNTTVYNYTWPLFPFIWDEARFYVGYKSDLGFISENLIKIVEKELGLDYLKRARMYKEILINDARAHVFPEHLEPQPKIFFRMDPNMWLEVKVQYLVQPRESGVVKNKIVKATMETFAHSPDKVQLPLESER